MADTFIFNNSIGWAHYRLKGGRRIFLLPTIGYGALIGGLILASLHFNPRDVPGVLMGWMVALLVLQVGTLLVYGGSTVRAAVRKDMTTGMLASHRLMPISGTEAIVGYILGAVPQPVTIFATNLLIGLLAAGPARIDPLDWILGNGLLFLFAACAWVAVVCLSFLSPKSAGALMFLGVILAIPGGIVLMAVPALTVICTPIIGPTAYGIIMKGAGGLTLYTVPIFCQICVTILFFIAAVRKYRRDDVLAAGPLFGLVIVGTFVAISAYGITNWRKIEPFLIPMGGGMFEVQIISSMIVASLIGLIPISAAAWLSEKYRRGRILNDTALGRRPADVLLIVPAVALIVTLLTVLYVPSRRFDHGHAGVTLISLTASLASIGFLMRLRYRTKSSASLLSVLWIVLTWVGPWLMAFGMMTMSGARTSDEVAAIWDQASTLACMSPIGTLIALWSQSEMHYLPGLIAQSILATSMAVLFYTRRAPRELFVPVVGSSS